jgi:hypothetical protein
MAQTVMADAQFSIVKTLVPCVGWETLFSGTRASEHPIFLSENGLRYDTNAGKPGYAPHLIRGLSVPVGSRIILWLPQIPTFPRSTPGERSYTFHIGWRLRNLFDYRTGRIPYHLARQAEGEPETVTDPGTRVVLPAAGHSIVYNKTQPTFPASVINEVIGEELMIGHPEMFGHHPDDVIQQGLFDSASYPFAADPSFMTYDLRAMGDEMLISITRPYDKASNFNDWDWTDWDRGLHAFFSGSSAAGVYAMIGSAP